MYVRMQKCVPVCVHVCTNVCMYMYVVTCVHESVAACVYAWLSGRICMCVCVWREGNNMDPGCGVCSVCVCA